MKPLFTLALVVVLAGCGGENTPAPGETPGAPQDAKSQALEAGAALMQDKTPVSKLNSYLDGFHFYSGNLGMQVEAHHYCEQINGDMHQCVIYDGNGEDARIMGVEYILSEKLFKTLPEDEKKLWHSHDYEVTSGTLIAPGIPDAAEHELMENLVATYGKTWHTWHSHDSRGATLPLGPAQLMMGFTADGQLQPALQAARDQRFGISTANKRQQRADIQAPPVQPGANSWMTGDAVQLKVESVGGEKAVE